MRAAEKWHSSDSSDVHLAALILGQTAAALTETGRPAGVPVVAISTCSPFTVNTQELEWLCAGTMSLSTQPPATMELIRDRFILRNMREVEGFLGTHSFLQPLLVSAHDWIEAVFGVGTVTYLEVFSYPDQPSERELFASIATHRSAVESLDLLDVFRSCWLGQALRRAEGRLVFDIEETWLSNGETS